MTTLSVPISGELEQFINKMVKEGKGSNKADVVRRALKSYAEEEAIDAVLKAQREPTLRGNLKELMKKLK
ncbi:MAG: hypothetical protein WAX44_02025 [Minisyncoccia bacterium]